MATHNSLAGTLKRALIGNYRLGAKNRQSLNQSVANIHFNNPNDYIKTLNYSYYHNIYSPLDRYTRYADFEAMDDVPEIHTALNIYADNATVKNEYDDILEIISEDDKILEALENLFYSRLDVESMLWNIVRNLCKYGDYFAYIDLIPEVGVTSLFTLPVQLVEREEGYDGDPRSVRFKLNAHSSGYGNSMMSYSFVNNSSSEQHYDYYQIAHFRLLGDDRYLPFSRSVLDSARRVYKQLMMIEDAMLIYRIARAPERRVFKINVGGIPAKDVEAYIKKVMSIMQGTNIMDSNGKLDTRYAPMSTIDNYYLPVRGNQDGSAIESLPGGENTAAIDDVKYIQKKLMMSLGVPKSFLGDESELSSKCLDLNTKILLYNGDIKTISELILDYENGIENYVYSFNIDKRLICKGEIEWAGITKRNTQVVEVILNNGSKIVCTPDHKFLIYDQTNKSDLYADSQFLYVEAQNLKIGDVVNSFTLETHGQPILIESVNILESTIDTGDLTIKDYHNFAIGISDTEAIFVHNSALASEDYQFGRTIQRIQQAVVQELNKIAIVHLIALGFDEDDCENFELQMANPSYLIDSQKIEIIQARSQLVDTLVQGKYMDKKTALIDFLNFTEDKFEQIRAGLIDDARFEKKLEAVASEDDSATTTEPDDQLGDFGDEDYGAEPEADAGGDEPMPEPREGEPTEDGGDGQPEIPTEPKAGVDKKKSGKKELQKSSTDLVKKRRKKVFADPMKQVTYNPLKTIDFGKISQMKIPKESALLGEVVNVSTELNEYVETITEELNINGDEPKELWQE